MACDVVVRKQKSEMRSGMRSAKVRRVGFVYSCTPSRKCFRNNVCLFSTFSLGPYACAPGLFCVIIIRFNFNKTQK